MNTKPINSTKKSKRPNVFTRDNLDWVPWIEPVAEESLSERQRESLVEAARAKSDYFRLLARDPDILEARTRTDKDIFYNTVDGLPRAERELAAAATSRFNGCIYCASVHARHAAVYSKNRPMLMNFLIRAYLPIWESAGTLLLRLLPRSAKHRRPSEKQRSKLFEQQVLMTMKFLTLFMPSAFLIGLIG